MKRIPLSQGKFAIVDDEDYPMLMKHKWTAQKTPYTYYAHRVIRLKKADLSNGYDIIFIPMGRQILNPPKGFLVDHKDGNGLDYRRSNLRICTRAQNAQNKQARKNGSSKYKGVSYIKKNKKKWSAFMSINKKCARLGSFDSEIEAAKAYDKAARKYYGEFARCNF